MEKTYMASSIRLTLLERQTHASILNKQELLTQCTARFIAATTAADRKRYQEGVTQLMRDLDLLNMELARFARNRQAIAHAREIAYQKEIAS